jgi:hypothetical protein
LLIIILGRLIKMEQIKSKIRQDLNL